MANYKPSAALTTDGDAVLDVASSATDQNAAQTPAAPVRRKRFPYSEDAFREIRDRADVFIAACDQRNADFTTRENFFLCTPSGSAEGATSKLHARSLIDPIPNKVVKAIIGLFTRNPIPSLQIRNEDSGDAEKVERFLRGLLSAQREIGETSVTADLAFALAIFGEGTLFVENQLALVDESEWDSIELPFSMSVPHPSTSYPQYATSGTRRGLRSHVAKVTTTYGETLENYPDTAKLGLTLKDSDEVTRYDYSDKNLHVCWLYEKTDTPILWAEMPGTLSEVMRVARRLSDSPSFLDKPEKTTQGVLYGYVKSGLGAAINIILTIYNTAAVDYANGKMLAKMRPGREDIGKNLIDWEATGDTTVILTDETLGPLIQHLIPQELTAFVGMTQAMRDEVLIPRLFTGQPPPGQMAASGINLLSESARRSVHHIQETLGLLYSEVLNKILKWIIAGEYHPVVFDDKGKVVLLPSEIGNCRVTATMKPDASSERQIILGLANMMANLRMGEEDWLRVMEEGNLIDSVSTSIDRMYERAVNEAERTAVGKTVIEEAARLNAAIAQVPDLNAPSSALPPSTAPMRAQPAMPAQPAPAAPGPFTAPEQPGSGVPQQMPPPEIAAMIQG